MALVTLVLAAASVAIAIFVARSKEPTYCGYPLSAWVKTLSERNRQDFGSRCTLNDAPDAISHIGTNGLPYLVQWLSYQCGRTPLRDTVYWATEKIPTLDKIEGLQSWAWSDTKDIRGEGAYIAFRILGETGAPAIPRLVEVAIKPGDILPQYRAVYALGAIGQPALNALLSIVTNQSVAGMVRCVAAEHIGYLGTNAAHAIPELLRALQSSDTCAASGAAEALAAIHLQPSSVVPALVHAAEHPRGMHERFALSALAKFGPEAREAIPALQKIAAGKDSLLAACATTAIAKIQIDSTAPRPE